MIKGGINFSKDNEYYTPKDIVDLFGQFEYDPATTKEKAEEFGVKYYDTIETNGLIRDWTKYKSIWINPPFTIKKDFLKKAVETFKNNNDIYIYILLPIEFMTTKIFNELTKDIGYKLFLPNGRIKFQSGLGKKSTSPAFGSIIIKLQSYKKEIELIEL